MIPKGGGKGEIGEEASKLSENNARRLLAICTELVNLCADVTGEIDPAAVAMLAFVKDDIRFDGPGATAGATSGDCFGYRSRGAANLNFAQEARFPTAKWFEDVADPQR
jgi:hypothetical protein